MMRIVCALLEILESRASGPTTLSWLTDSPLALQNRDIRIANLERQSINDMADASKLFVFIS